MKPGARSLFVDSACAGRNSYRSNRLRHANQHGFSSPLLQYRDRKPSLAKTKRPSDLQVQTDLFCTPLFYSEEVHNAYRHWDLGSKTRLDKASIDGFRSLLSENHDKNPQQIRKSSEIVASSPGVCITGTEQCPGLNNTNCVLSYTSVGDPASNRS